MADAAASSWVQRWRMRSPAERGALIEAAVLLAAASLTVKVSPFRLVARIAAMDVRGLPPADSTDTIAVVAWAIGAVARRAGFRAVCIEQGLAAQVMLRRRGLASTLHYGVAKDKNAGLAAHVWVRYRAHAVVGCVEAPRFRLLASFPSCDARHRRQRLR